MIVETKRLLLRKINVEDAAFVLRLGMDFKKTVKMSDDDPGNHSLLLTNKNEIRSSPIP